MSSISFSAIHTFTVVAKELSFTRAADILHITPSAVSHQMKLLESQMGVSLFHRQSKGVRLTFAGEKLQQYASHGVSNIQYGIAQSQFASLKEKLVIAVIPSLGQQWLIARLSDFYRHYPNVDIELVAADQLINFDTERCDGHIHFGSGDYVSGRAEFLSHEHVYPVCHPSLSDDTEESTFNALLAEYPLLAYKAGIEDERGGITWGDWFAQFDIARPATLNLRNFSHVSMALTAAKCKQGIALGWHKMVEDDIATGQLCRLGEQALSLSFSYYLVAPQRSWESRIFNQFYDWLNAQMSS